MDAVGVQRGHRAARSRSEPDDDGVEAPAVVACPADQPESMDHRAVPGELVVDVEDVQGEIAAARPVVHRLEGDQGQTLVDGALRDLSVLHAVRPAPEDLAVAEVVQVGRLRLGEHHDIARRDHIGAGGDAADQGTQCVVGRAEPRAVPGLEHDALTQLARDAVEASRVKRQAALIRFRGGGKDAERQWNGRIGIGRHGGSLMGATVAPSLQPKPTRCGGRGIRTHETFLPTSFQDWLHRPLGQPSRRRRNRRRPILTDRARTASLARWNGLEQVTWPAVWPCTSDGRSTERRPSEPASSRVAGAAWPEPASPAPASPEPASPEPAAPGRSGRPPSPHRCRRSARPACRSASAVISVSAPHPSSARRRALT